MADPHSSYFHSTIYQFDTDAIKQIVGDFSDSIDNVQARCWYDPELHGFQISCPNAVGAFADQALYDAISNCIGRELQLQLDENHVATLDRFQESIVDNYTQMLGDGLSVSSDEERYETERRRTLDEESPSRFKAVTMHAVSNEAAGSKLKMFNLRDVTEQTLERTLVEHSPSATRVIRSYLTCRVAKWSPQEECYAFNGRIGASLDGIHTTDMLPDCPFETIEGQARQFDQSETRENVDAASWEFQGAKPSVQQFLAGMGDTVPVDPNTAPDTSELPADAVKYQKGPVYEATSYGRTRRPPVVRRGSSDSNSSSSNEDSSEGEDDGDNPPKDSLAALRRNSQNTRPSALREKQEVDEPAPILASLAARAQHPVEEESSAARLAARATATATSDLESQPTPRALDQRESYPVSQNAGTPSVSDASRLPDYDRVYALVDQHGLTGKATLQARWEHENNVQAPPKRNKWGIQSRKTMQSEDLSPRPTGASSAPMSISTGPDRAQAHGTPTPTASPPPGASMLNSQHHHDKGAKLQSWENQRHAPAPVPTTDDLVDVRSSRKVFPASSAVPPGFGVKFHGQESVSSSPTVKSPSRQNSTKGPAQQSSYSSSGLRGQTAPFYPPGLTRNDNSLPSRNDSTAPSATDDSDLIDLSHETESVATNGTLRGNMPHLQPNSTSSENDESDGDTITERLQPASDQQHTKKFTMRQKAPKKPKKKPAKPKAQLPMPEALPAPRPSKAKNPVKPPPVVPTQPTVAAGKSSQHEQEAVGDQAADNATSSEDHGIVGLIEKLRAFQGLPELEVAVSFGTILVRHRDDREFNITNYDSKKLRDSLQTHEDAGSLHRTFLPRMTTSTSDAVYMLELIEGAKAQPVVKYEFGMQNPQGEMRTLTFDQQDPQNFVLLRDKQPLGTLYMHYPIRVWDAMFEVSQSDVDDSEVEPLESLVSSIQTVGEAPSFMAHFPMRSFQPISVHVKRVFPTEIGNSAGIQVRVTEVQHLKIEAVNGSKHFNLRAIAMERERMIDEQRLWFECSMHIPLEDRMDPGVLQLLVDNFVESIDGVGFHNQGPYMRSEIEESAEVIPGFW